MLTSFKNTFIIIISLIFLNTNYAQENVSIKTLSKTIAYSKWGLQHGFQFSFQNEKRCIMGLELAVNVNTSYLQNRFRPVNQLFFGYIPIKFASFSMATIFGLTLDTYKFNEINRLNNLAFSGGYMMEIGSRKWKFIQMSYLGIGNEYHWEGQRNNYIDYKINIGIQYEL